MRSTIALFASAFAGSVLIVPIARAADAVSAQDAEFAKLAAAGGTAEVTFGQTAMHQAQDPLVKQFGTQMDQDHSPANKQLMVLANQKNIDAPAAMDPAHQALLVKLNAMSGLGFDRAYMQSQLQDHQTQIALFQQEAAQGQDPQLKAYAVQTLPILQRHYQMAQQVAQSVGASSGAGSTGSTSGSSGSTGGGSQ
jgi:putative membrane protein